MSIFKEIKIEFIWDKKCYLLASNLFYEYNQKNGIKRFFGFFLIALAQLGVVAALKKDSYFLLLFSTIMLIYWYYLKAKIREYYLLKKFSKDENADKKLSFTITQNSIKADLQEVEYSDISFVIVGASGYLLKIKQQMIFFPSSSIAFEDKESFSSLLRAKNIALLKL